MPRSPRSAALAALGVTLLLTAGACSSTPTPTPEPTQTVTVPEPSATPEPEPIALDCETLIGDAAVAELTGSGQDLTPQAEFHQKVLDEAPANESIKAPTLALFVNNDGVVCQWGSGVNATELYGFSPIDAPDAAEQQSRLTARGYTSSSFAGGGMLFTDPLQEERIDHFYLFVDGYWYMATDEARIATMVTTFPND